MWGARKRLVVKMAYARSKGKDLNAGSNNLRQKKKFRDTLKKSSFPRRWESILLILLGFYFEKHDFSE